MKKKKQKTKSQLNDPQNVPQKKIKQHEKRSCILICLEI